MQTSRHLALLVVLLVASLAVAMVVTGNTTSQATADGSNISVGAGEQLSTILSTTDDDVRTDIEEAGLEFQFERASDTARADSLADRAETLRERSAEIREAYEELTEEYEAGEITASEYAQQLAILNNRAENVLASLDTVAARAENVSRFDLRAAGFERSTLENASEQLSDLNGTGPAALLERFTGQRTGELEISDGDGLRIEVENEDGERSREIRYPDDGDDSMTVSQSEALETAREHLSDREGNWSLTEASVHADSGYYKFEFDLDAPSLEGESEIRIDGSSGDPLRIEEEIEPEDDDGEDDEADDDDAADDDADDDAEPDGEDDEQDEDLFILVSDGVVQPNETVTLQVQSPGGPVENATVSLDDEVVGQTDANGSIDLSLPSDEFEIVATHGDAEAELEFEFEREEESESDAIARNVTIDATLENRTVTVRITHDVEPIPDVAVEINGEDAGVTDAAGEASGTIDADSEEVEVELERGEFEAESTYEIQGGDLVQTAQEIEFGDEGGVDVDGDDDADTGDDADGDDGVEEDDEESEDDTSGDTDDDDDGDDTDDDSNSDDSDDDEEDDDDS